MNTIKGYVTAILHRHVLVKGNPVSLDPTLGRWIKGLEHTKGILHLIMPAWCLELVLSTLARAPVAPIETCQIKYLTWKIVFLLAITAALRAVEMHALCYKPSNILPMADKSRATPSPSRSSPTGWSSASNMHMTRMGSPPLMG